MKLHALFLFILLLGVTLAGCANPTGSPSGRNIEVLYINETDINYYIYVFMMQYPKDEKGDENGFGRNGGGFQTTYDCQGQFTAIPDSFWMRLEVREVKPNQAEIHAPERRGGALVFEGNWTGLHCAESYIFRYNGPSDVEFFQTYDFGQDERKKRELERVPP